MNTYKNARAVPADTNQTALISAPEAGKVKLVKSILIANTHALSVSATVEWLDSSDSNAVTRVAYGVSIPPNASLTLLTESPIVLEEGDTLKVYTSLASKLEFTASVLEKTA